MVKDMNKIKPETKPNTAATVYSFTLGLVTCTKRKNNIHIVSKKMNLKNDFFIIYLFNWLLLSAITDNKFFNSSSVLTSMPST